MARAERLAFVCKNNELYCKMYNFEWFSGFAISQTRKSIHSFHEQIKLSGIDNIIEISRKGENEIGNKLSAFNLILEINNRKCCVENIYHSSKVFDNLQFVECLKMNPSESKKYVKEQVEQLGLQLTGFKFNGKTFPLSSKSLCYDYIYVLALNQNTQLGEEIIKYDCFTDIVFNQNKIVATQARSCALFKYLKTNGLIDDFINDPFSFLPLYRKLF